MNKITIASPDKISLSMFTSYLKAVLPDAPSYRVCHMNSLMRSEDVEICIRNTDDLTNKSIYVYYAKRAINKNVNKVIPSKLIESCDVVVWFDLFATDFKVMKDESEFEKTYKDRWTRNIEKMNKAKGGV